MEKLSKYYPTGSDQPIGAGVGKSGISGTTANPGVYDANDNDNDHFNSKVQGNMWKNLIDSIGVDFDGKPQLIYYVYTLIPSNEPRLPYMAPYKEFKCYRYTNSSATIKHRDLIDKYAGDNVPSLAFDTGRIDMVYYLHSIYMYVAEANDKRLSSIEAMTTHTETFAKITKINCVYGNCTTILDSFEELDFYNMSIRNRLKGCAFYDWNMCNSDMGKMENYGKMLKLMENNCIAGVGSVIRLTPWY